MYVVLTREYCATLKKNKLLSASVKNVITEIINRAVLGKMLSKYINCCWQPNKFKQMLIQMIAKNPGFTTLVTIFKN